LLAFNEQDLTCLVSRTVIDGLDIIISNDTHRQLGTLLLNAPDGRLRLRNLLPAFQAHYDLLLIDTHGARSVLLEMAVLASEQAVSPVTPEILAARELRRGTLQLLADIAPFRRLGISPPPLRLLMNRVPPVLTNARMIQGALRLVFQKEVGVEVLSVEIPAIEAFLRAATQGLPAHRVEHRRPSGRIAPAALEVMRDLGMMKLLLFKVEWVATGKTGLCRTTTRGGFTRTRRMFSSFVIARRVATKQSTGLHGWDVLPVRAAACFPLGVCVAERVCGLPRCARTDDKVGGASCSPVG
jgi:chromosome partitioning related protein ParA